MASPKNAAIKLHPNMALRQVRTATGLSQNRFAQLVGVSAAYIQAVELGQRNASVELAESVSIQTGASPVCLAEAWSQAFDLNGKPYSVESYEEFTSKRGEPPRYEEIARMLESTTVILEAAGRVGKSSLVADLLRSKLREFVQQVIIIDKVDEELRITLGPTGRTTVGQMRADTDLARRVAFVDDKSLPDDAVILLNRRGGGHEEVINKLFPKSDSAQNWKGCVNVTAGRQIDLRHAFSINSHESRSA